jgi:hypothetical protein
LAYLARYSRTLRKLERAQFVELLAGREKLASIAQISDAPIESNNPAQSMKRNPASPDPANLVIDILAGASNEDEQLRAFHRALNANLRLPLDGFVIGEPVSVVKISYHGNPKRGPQPAEKPTVESMT